MVVQCFADVGVPLSDADVRALMSRCGRSLVGSAHIRLDYNKLLDTLDGGYSCVYCMIMMLPSLWHQRVYCDCVFVIQQVPRRHPHTLSHPSPGLIRVCCCARVVDDYA